MRKRRKTSPPPACYASTVPGLEEIAAEEIAQVLEGDVKKTARGLVVFRTAEVGPQLLQLRTSEDVFLLGWGTDELTFRANDLKQIQRWTAHDVNWQHLFNLHHSIRPKPSGRPTFRLIAQMSGKHVYRRVDAQKALAKGLAGKIPDSWRIAEENASVEIWLTILGRSAVCGVRLSDRSMRHRRYKTEHVPASLRPTVAAAMVRLANVREGQRLLDTTCGAGTILAEQLETPGRRSKVRVVGGDLSLDALNGSRINLRRHGEIPLCRWDAACLPIPTTYFDAVVSNPPFGKQLSRGEDLGELYRRITSEQNRVLKSGGVCVLLTSDYSLLKQAVSRLPWKAERQIRVRVLGQDAMISVWRKQRGE